MATALLVCDEIMLSAIMIINFVLIHSHVSCISMDDEIMLIEIYKLLEQGDFESVQRFEIQKDLFHTR